MCDNPDAMCCALCAVRFALCEMNFVKDPFSCSISYETN
jgi:hypothetical protein